MSQELVNSSTSQVLSVFSHMQVFEDAQRIAKALSSSTLVPKAYQGNIPNTLIAMEISNRIGVSPFLVMQNLDVIQGKPAWNSKFVIASINASGRFSPLQFKIERLGKKKVDYSVWVGEAPNRRKEIKSIEIDDMRCIAYATDRNGQVCEGPAVTIEMAVKEGWYTKVDSKWPTMPDVMIRYRAGKFFGNFYVPEVLLGMPTTDEVIDSVGTVEVLPQKPSAIESINQKIATNQKIAPNIEEAKVVEEEAKVEPAKRTRKPKQDSPQPVEEPTQPVEEATEENSDLV